MSCFSWGKYVSGYFSVESSLTLLRLKKHHVFFFFLFVFLWTYMITHPNVHTHTYMHAVHTYCKYKHAYIYDFWGLCFQQSKHFKRIFVYLCTLLLCKWIGGEVPVYTLSNPITVSHRHRRAKRSVCSSLGKKLTWENSLWDHRADKWHSHVRRSACDRTKATSHIHYIELLWSESWQCTSDFTSK